MAVESSKLKIDGIRPAVKTFRVFDKRGGAWVERYTGMSEDIWMNHLDKGLRVAISTDGSILIVEPPSFNDQPIFGVKVEMGENNTVIIKRNFFSSLKQWLGIGVKGKVYVYGNKNKDKRL